MAYDLLFVLGGLALLIVGGELLVRGAVTTAERLGMSPLLIGLTLVGFGTSMPELVTSVQAAMRESPGIAVGNVVGSNIANILLILGLAALIMPVAVQSRALRRDGGIALAAALILTAVGYSTALDRLVGAAFVLALSAYLIFAWYQESQAEAHGHSAAFDKAEAYGELRRRRAAAAGNGMAIALSLGLAIAGLMIVVAGGNVLVEGAISLARRAGVSETIIGLTIVAVGTSMPELVTSVVAALRGHAEVAIGNIMGSNIYNVFGIAGITGLLSPTIVPPEIVSFDNLVMVAASLLLLVFARTGYTVGRSEGACLLAGYAAYIWALWPV